MSSRRKMSNRISSMLSFKLRSTSLWKLKIDTMFNFVISADDASFFIVGMLTGFDDAGRRGAVRDLAIADTLSQSRHLRQA